MGVEDLEQGVLEGDDLGLCDVAAAEGGDYLLGDGEGLLFQSRPLPGEGDYNAPFVRFRAASVYNTLLLEAF